MDKKDRLNKVITEIVVFLCICFALGVAVVHYLDYGEIKYISLFLIFGYFFGQVVRIVKRVLRSGTTKSNIGLP
jgi:hypothetical protein